MKIGIMLRHMGQHGGGVLVYTHHLLQELLRLDQKNEYFLYYWGSDEAAPESSERVHCRNLRAPAVPVWDQWSMWRAAERDQLDLIFNPKYSLPLLASQKSVFVSHGMDWFVMPWGSKWADRMNHRYMIPRYAKKANHIIAVSDTTRNHLIEFLQLPAEKVTTVYLGVDDCFRQVASDARRNEIRDRYRLPDRYFLYCGQIYPPKNFGRLIEAYAKVGPELGIPLVVAGKHTWLCEEELKQIDRLGIADWVVRPGWIGRDALPTFYAMADALLMPSLYEACPLPIIEAMASGCAIVTANRHGTAELAGEAGCLVDPESVESIADGIRRVVDDHDDRHERIQAGLQRSAQFTWPRCAQKTLDVLERVLGSSA